MAAASAQMPVIFSFAMLVRRYHSVRRPHLRQLKSEPFTQKFGHAPGLTQIFWNRLQANRFVDLVAGLADDKVTAKTVLGYCDGREMHLFEGAIEGTVSRVPAGPEDFQWDCVFIPDGSTKTFAEMGTDKDDISMRRKALDQFAAHLTATTGLK